jgi:hypothetical protein
VGQARDFGSTGFRQLSMLAYVFMHFCKGCVNCCPMVAFLLHREFAASGQACRAKYSRSGIMSSHVRLKGKFA